MADDRRDSSGISATTLALAALGSAAATFVIARFGLEGTIAGAALMPVVVALVTELARRPARRVRARTGAVRPTRAPDAPPRRVYRAEREPRVALGRVSWSRVFATAGVAFGLVVGAVTIADIGLGRSVASDRDTTFFGREQRAPKQEQPAEREDEPREPAPTQAETATTKPPAESTTETVETVPEETPTVPTETVETTP